MGNLHKQKLTLLGAIFLAACGGGGGGGGDAGTSNGGGYGTTPSNTAPTIDNSTNDYSIIEGTTNGFMVNASDADGNSLTYSVSGNDGSKMSITSTGVVSFINAPDYENPEDENGDNIYSFNVSVSDGSVSIAEGFTITVTNDTSDDIVFSRFVSYPFIEKYPFEESIGIAAIFHCSYPGLLVPAPLSQKTW